MAESTTLHNYLFNSTIPPSTTTEFWTSENEHDQTQMMVKRILYSLYYRIYMFSISCVFMLYMTLVIGLPILVILIVIKLRSKQIIEQKRQYWANHQTLDRVIKSKVQKFADDLKVKALEEEERLQKEAEENIRKIGHV
jgi:ABC-type multidrug transport system fused ATPase/permease subunit